MRGKEKQNKKIELGPTEQNKSKQKDKQGRRRQKKLTMKIDEDEDEARRSPKKPEEVDRCKTGREEKRARVSELFPEGR